MLRRLRAGSHLARCSSSPPCSTVRFPWLRCFRTSQPQHRHQQQRSCSGTNRSTCAARTALRAASTCGTGCRREEAERDPRRSGPPRPPRPPAAPPGGPRPSRLRRAPGAGAGPRPPSAAAGACGCRHVRGRRRRSGGTERSAAPAPSAQSCAAATPRVPRQRRPLPPRGGASPAARAGAATNASAAARAPPRPRRPDAAGRSLPHAVARGNGRRARRCAAGARGPEPHACRYRWGPAPGSATGLSSEFVGRSLRYLTDPLGCPVRCAVVFNNTCYRFERGREGSIDFLFRDKLVDSCAPRPGTSPRPLGDPRHPRAGKQRGEEVTEAAGRALTRDTCWGGRPEGRASIAPVKGAKSWLRVTDIFNLYKC